MGLPINASMKTKEKVAALENYIQDLEVMTASAWWWLVWQWALIDLVSMMVTTTMAMMGRRARSRPRRMRWA